MARLSFGAIHDKAAIAPYGSTQKQLMQALLKDAFAG